MADQAGGAGGAIPRADDDLSQNINAAIWALTGVSGVLLLLRLWGKWLKHRGLWWDDHLLIVSWLLLVASSIVGSYNNTLGFGKHIFVVDPANLAAIDLNGNIAASVSILAAVWSKTSFALTLLRLVRGWMKPTIWFIIISMNMAMVVTTIITWLRCTPPNKVAQCVSADIYVGYSTFSGGYSAAMDIVLALLPWPLIWKLQMKKKEKLGVAIAMSLGIFAGATAIMKCVAIKTLANGDFTYDGAKLVIWGTAEVATTIMATSIPVLRVLVREVRSSASRYYGYVQETGKGGAGDPRAGENGGGTVRSTYRTVITAKGDGDGDNHGLRGVSSSSPLGVSGSVEDDGSDKSILEATTPGATVPGKILQTSEVRLEYSRRGNEEDGYEMDRVERMV